MELSDDRVADCRELFPVDKADLNGSGCSTVPSHQMDAVDRGLRDALALDQHLDARRESNYLVAASQFVMRQATVRWERRKRGGRRHMWVALSPSRDNHRSSRFLGLMMTSRRKQTRSAWEVSVPGGCVVAADVQTMGVDEFEAAAPIRPHVAGLSAETMQEIARGVADVLDLS